MIINIIRTPFCQYIRKGNNIYIILIILTIGLLNFSFFSPHQFHSSWLKKDLTVHVQFSHPIKTGKSGFHTIITIDSFFINQTAKPVYYKTYLRIKELPDSIIFFKSAWLSLKLFPFKLDSNHTLNSFHRYLKNQQIFSTSSLNHNGVISVIYINGVARSILFFQNKIKSIFENAYRNPNKGLAIALLIGDTQLVENEILTAYSNTGITHIIAISGMHMQLIIGVFLLLFS